MANVVTVLSKVRSLIQQLVGKDGQLTISLKGEIKKFVKGGASIPARELIEAMVSAKMQPRDTATMIISQILEKNPLPTKERVDLIYEFTYLLEKSREVLADMKEKPPTGDALLRPSQKLELAV